MNSFSSSTVPVQLEPQGALIVTSFIVTMACSSCCCCIEQLVAAVLVVFDLKKRPPAVSMFRNPFHRRAAINQ